jgi:hypothetical protein
MAKDSCCLQFWWFFSTDTKMLFSVAGFQTSTVKKKNIEKKKL